VTPLVVIDASVPGAEALYAGFAANGASLAVYGPAEWAAPADRVSEATASYLSLYADSVLAPGLPALLAGPRR
jgi:hypothetical protein